MTACYGVGEVHCTARLRPDDNKLLSVDNGFILSPNLKSDSESARAFILREREREREGEIEGNSGIFCFCSSFQVSIRPPLSPSFHFCLRHPLLQIVDTFPSDVPTTYNM